MKIEEVAKNVIDPPSMAKTIQLSVRKKDNFHPQVDGRGNIAKFLQVFSEENQKVIKNLFYRIRDFAKDNQISLKFVLEKDLGLVIIKVYDGEGNIIRQIPPEEVLALSAELEKKKGFLLNVKM